MGISDINDLLEMGEGELTLSTEVWMIFRALKNVYSWGLE